MKVSDNRRCQSHKSYYLVQKSLVGYICADTIYYGCHLYRTEPVHITSLPEYFRESPEYEKILDQILVRV
jgi:hypothetical protein